MTKLLCVIGLLLLSYGVVEAVDFDFTLPRPYETPQVGCKILVCNADGANCRTPCEEQMREAMKIVDRYLPHREALTGSTLEYCDDVCMAERALDAAKRQAAAMAKWRAAYKECVQ